MQDESSSARSALQKLALNEGAKAFVMSTPFLYNALLAAARPYTGGETRLEALALTRSLNLSGHQVTIDYMGESARDRGSAIAAACEFELLAHDLLKEGLNANISLDLSHLGLLIDPALSTKHLVAIAGHLARMPCDVIVGAEGADRVDSVLHATCQALKVQRNIGVTLQAYLPRTQKDIKSVLVSAPSVVRVVKGAFDPPSGAYPRGPLLNDSYLRVVEDVLSSGTRVSVATHDAILIDAVIERFGGPALQQSLLQFEFLAGIAEDQWTRVKSLGFPTQVYVVYGREWFLYLCNRLAEYPASLIPAFARAMEAAESSSTSDLFS